MKKEKEEKLIRAKKHAASKEGFCFSKEYINTDEKLTWKCSNENHEPWNASFFKVVNTGTWCPVCAREKLINKKRNGNGLKTSKEHAALNGGECLSTNYKNSRIKLHWKCNEGHEWNASFDHVVNHKTWCPKCADEKVSQKRRNPNGLDMAKSHAISKGGECLSTEYKNNRSKLHWRCGNGHEWHSSFNHAINNDRWCSICRNNNISEKRTRIVFEKFFKEKFPSSRPEWNINPWTGRLLELDGYCKQFNIAFEYDGEHHFKLARYCFGQKAKDLTYQKFKDHQKKKNCKNKNVLLINIKHVKDNSIQDFNFFLLNIIDSCKASGLIMEFDEQEKIELEKDFYSI